MKRFTLKGSEEATTSEKLEKLKGIDSTALEDLEPKPNGEHKKTREVAFASEALASTDVVEVSMNKIDRISAGNSELYAEIQQALRDGGSGQAKELAAAPGSLGTSKGTVLGRRLPSAVSLLDRLQNTFLPKTNQEAIEFAQAWYEKDDLLGSLIDLKVKFSASGFELTPVKTEKAYIESLIAKLKTKMAASGTEGGAEGAEGAEGDEGGSTEDGGAEGEDVNSVKDQQMLEELQELLTLAELKDKLDNIATYYHLDQVVESLLQDYFVTDSMILYWRTQGAGAESAEIDANLSLEFLQTPVNGLQEVNAISPHDVIWDNSLGNNELRAAIPAALEERIRIALDDEDRSTEMIEGLIASGVPQKAIDAVDEGEQYYMLVKEEGDNWAIVSRERKNHGLATPRMTRLFLPLATRYMMTEGEFAGGVMMKHFIFHIKSGESIQSGPQAGTRESWATKEECEFYTRQFSGVDKTRVFATDHTVELSFVHPPVEMFSIAKYESSNRRVFDFVGISLMLYSGEGGKYSGGSLSVKRLLADIVEARGKIAKMFSDMLNGEDMLNAIEYPPEYRVKSVFNENTVKEPKQVLDEVTALVEGHMTGPRTALSELGRNPATVRQDIVIAQAEDSVANLWGGKFSTESGEFPDGENDNNRQDQGTTSQGGKRGGRPPNEGTTQSEATRTQEPTPAG